MQALILAAGRGSRLGNASNGIPKCLLEIGRRPLVEHQLEALSAAGVGPVGMVLGYCGDEVRERVGLRAEYVVNAEWATTNSLYSFWLARDWVQGGVMVLNSDILFDPRVLERVLAAGGDALAYDSSSGDGREHMKVKVDGGRLVDMGKELPVEEAAGENLGVLCFTEATARVLFARAGELVAQGRRKDWLGAAVREVARERNIRAVDVAGLPWGEVDFPFDLDRARKEVLPAIEAAARRRRPARRIARWLAVAAAAALLAAAAWRLAAPAEETVWQSLDVRGAPPATLSAASGRQSWSLLSGSQSATVTVVGPGPLRIDSRALAPGGDDAHYVLEVTLDGERLDWFKLKAKPSRTATYEGSAVGKTRRITVEVPAGPHEVGVRLVAADSRRCLVRFRGIERDDEDEDEGPASDEGDGPRTAAR